MPEISYAPDPRPQPPYTVPSRGFGPPKGTGGTYTGLVTFNHAGAISTQWIRRASDTQGVSLEMSKKGQLGNADGAVGLNTGIFQLRGFGWNGSAYAAAGRLQLNADIGADFSLTNSGSFWRFQSVAPGTTSEIETLRVTTSGLSFLGTKVVGGRDTGWTTFTGTANKNAGALDTGTATTAQVAQVVKSIMDALITHGLLGA